MIAHFLAITLCAMFPFSIDIPEPSYAVAARNISAKFTGNKGVVLHIGDSITYANPYSAWPRYGVGKSDIDKATLKWMHTNADDKTKDGWHLARVDHPDGGRSETASSGMRADELLKGGHNKLPAFEKLLKKYRPQAIVLMIGTNDASAQRRVSAYIADVEKMVELALEQNAIPIITTIPPHVQQGKLATSYNTALRELAKKQQLPLIDYEAEILKRRPNDWNGTLLQKNDVHPSGDVGKTTVASEPTEENLSKSGYLLRGWLTLQKLSEVKWFIWDSVKIE